MDFINKLNSSSKALNKKVTKTKKIKISFLTRKQKKIIKDSNQYNTKYPFSPKLAWSFVEEVLQDNPVVATTLNSKLVEHLSITGKGAYIIFNKTDEQHEFAYELQILVIADHKVKILVYDENENILIERVTRLFLLDDLE